MCILLNILMVYNLIVPTFLLWHFITILWANVWCRLAFVSGIWALASKPWRCWFVWSTKSRVVLLPSPSMSALKFVTVHAGVLLASICTCWQLIHVCSRNICYYASSFMHQYTWYLLLVLYILSHLLVDSFTFQFKSVE